MEDKIILLILSLFLTLGIVRVSAFIFHDSANYSKESPRDSEAKTLTGILRRQTGFDWHHIHIGFILLCVAVPLLIVGFISSPLVIIFGAGLSLVLDQLLPWLEWGNYFGNEMLMFSFLFHLIILEIILIFYVINFS